MQYAVIMAGGSGTRFWPLSTTKNPKQCLSLISNKPLIQETIERLLPLFPKENIYIATNQKLAEKIGKIIPSKYIIEPCARNTTACIGLACVELLKNDPEAIIFIETADHVYKDTQLYLNHIKQAIELAKQDKIAIIGIKPTYPSTGFGYIKQGEKYKEAYLVEEFKEKPNKETAKQFLEDGNYLWNSGMFIFKAQTMLNELKKYKQKIYNSLMNIYNGENIEKEFENIESISIDYSIAENSDKLIMIRGEFPWDDVGSYLSLERMREKDENGNIVQGKFVNIDSKDNIVFANKPIATVGVNNLIIVQTDEVTLILPKDREQEVKEICKKFKF